MLLYVVTSGVDHDNPGAGGKVVGWADTIETAQFLADHYPDTSIAQREVSRAEILSWVRQWGYENAQKGLPREHSLKPDEMQAYYAGWDAYHAENAREGG